MEYNQTVSTIAHEIYIINLTRVQISIIALSIKGVEARNGYKSKYDKKITSKKRREIYTYLKSTRVKPFDGNLNWITLSIRRQNRSFINTSKTPFSNLEHPVKTIGSFSKFLKSENSKTVFLLFVQILHTLWRRHGTSRVCCAIRGRILLLFALVLQFRSGFGFLFEEKTLHFVIIRSSCCWE